MNQSRLQPGWSWLCAGGSPESPAVCPKSGLGGSGLWAPFKAIGDQECPSRPSKPGPPNPGLGRPYHRAPLAPRIHCVVLDLKARPSRRGSQPGERALCAGPPCACALALPQPAKRRAASRS